VHNDSKIGGILSIISGGFGILSMFMIILVIVMLYYMSSDFYYSNLPDEMMNIMYIIYGVMGVFMALLGVLAIIGGVYALKRKSWGLALAGAIASTITFFPCGIAAIIFIAKSQPDFKKVPPVNPDQVPASDSTPDNTPSLS
jgi:hypothetical protein